MRGWWSSVCLFVGTYWQWSSSRGSGKARVYILVGNLGSPLAAAAGLDAAAHVACQPRPAPGCCLPEAERFASPGARTA